MRESEDEVPENWFDIVIFFLPFAPCSILLCVPPCVDSFGSLAKLSLFSKLVKTIQQQEIVGVREPKKSRESSGEFRILLAKVRKSRRRVCGGVSLVC